MSKDGYYAISSGVYPPSIKLFDVRELSLKCMRGTDSEVVDFALLDEDYTKIVFAMMDRNLEFHAAYGKHYKTRVPK